MNEELIRMVLEECRRRCNYYKAESEKMSDPEYRIASIWSRISYDSVISMLEYALDGNYECLMQFMTEEPE